MGRNNRGQEHSASSWSKRRILVLLGSVISLRALAQSSLDVDVDGAVVNVGGALTGLVTAKQAVGTLDVKNLTDTRVSVTLPAAVNAGVALAGEASAEQNIGRLKSQSAAASSLSVSVSGALVNARGLAF